MDSQNVDGDTALILACCRGRKDCIRALLDHGADTRIRNKIGKIARDKMMEIVQILDEVRIIHRTHIICSINFLPNDCFNVLIIHSAVIFVLFYSYKLFRAA